MRQQSSDFGLVVVPVGISVGEAAVDAATGHPGRVAFVIVVPGAGRGLHRPIAAAMPYKDRASIKRTHRRFEIRHVVVKGEE